MSTPTSRIALRPEDEARVKESGKLSKQLNRLQETLSRIRSAPPAGHARNRKELEAALTKAQTAMETSLSIPDTDTQTSRTQRKELKRLCQSLEVLDQQNRFSDVINKRLPKKGIYIGIDLGGTNAQVAAVSSRGETLASKKVAVAGIEDPEEVTSLLASEVQLLVSETGGKWKQVVGLGIGAAGTIDLEEGVVIFAPNLNWRDVPARSMLETKLKIPVTLDNDVNVGTLGEWALGAGRGYQTIVGIFWGTGIGGGLIVNGELIRGANGMAAEVGHMVVDPRGPKCGCGNIGCMESIAGRRSIARDIRSAIRAGEATIITELVGKNPKVIRSGDLREAVKQRDKVALRVLKNAAAAVGLGMANIANLVDPDAFIIGGGVVEALGEWIVEESTEAAKKDIISVDQRQLTVLPAMIGDNAGALGGAILAMRMGE
ncbi:MAG: ROK family protein [Armatimonadetes bacterium CG07_land_8_20_14_0_80_59_28]|nr:MAG: ROK family protein [Armatimonadetes bacterium CG07_land_8_20_14_0_80_59_28]